MHLKDLVEILIKISHTELSDQTYNISTGISYKCSQIYNKVKQNLKERGIKLKQYEDKGLRLGENGKLLYPL